MIDIFNITFGIITIASFVFAIWSYKKMKQIEDLKDKGVGGIKQLAKRIKLQGNGSIYEGLADGIIAFCDTLLVKTEVLSTGDYKMRLHPYERPPMESRIAVIIDDPEAINGKALHAISKKIVGVKYNHLVSGPYYKLPLIGEYEVTFRVKLGEYPENLPEDKPIISVDVYDLYGGKITLTKKELSPRDFIVKGEYNEFTLRFSYMDLNQILEYRIELIQYRIEAFTDLITVKKIS